MVAIEKSIMDKQISLFATELDDQKDFIKSNLEDTIKMYSSSMSKIELNFLNKIIAEVKNKKRNLLTTNEFQDLITSIGEVPDKKLKIVVKNKVTYLSDLILSDFGYDTLRANFYPKFYDAVGIKSCVYCNSQLAVTVEKNRYPQIKKGRKKPLYSLGKEISAKYQLDHLHPKIKYPYLSASVFNLYPTCATCNNIKRTSEVDFDLYQEVATSSKYKFCLEPIGKVEYFNTPDRKFLKVLFLDPDKPNENIMVPGSFEDTFHISSIYNTQIDIVEELILKKKIYDKTYKTILKRAFSEIFCDVNISNRLLIGNYLGENEIHKRPMAKFTQDIARELKLIP